MFLFLFLLSVLASGAGYVELTNPLLGFAITVPADWTMGTGVIRDTVIGINYPLYPSPASPYITFTYASVSPLEAAKFMALYLRPIAVGETQLRPAGNPNEYRLTATFDGGILGPVLGQWIFRQQQWKTYVVGVLVLANVADQFTNEINTAVNSCRLIKQTVISRFFHEPSMDAFILTLPYGWTYQGNIQSGYNVPAAYVFEVQSPDGLTGCFSSPPVDSVLPETNLQGIAYGLVLESLQQKVSDLQVEKITLLTQAGAQYTQFMQVLAQIQNVVGERALVDYIGTKNGVPVRIRVEIWFRIVPGLIPGAPAYGHCDITGVWAPAANFQEQSALAQAVLASLWETPNWRQLVKKTTIDVVDFRTKVGQKAADQWDSYIRSVDVWEDPATGDRKETPYGQTAAKDAQGNYYNIPEGMDVPAGMTPLQKI